MGRVARPAAGSAPAAATLSCLRSAKLIHGKASVDQTCVVEVDWPTLYRSRLRAFKICQQYDNQAYEVVMLLV